MKVNELIKLLQESVEENPEVGEYGVNVDIMGYDGSYAELTDIYVNKSLKYVDLESE